MNDTAEGRPLEHQHEPQNESKSTKMERKPLVFVAIAVAVVAGALLFYFLYLQHPSRQILARVNDDKITVDQFNRELAKVEPALIREMLREEPSSLLERMIVRTLLLQEAKKQGVSAPVKTYKDAAANALPPEESIIAELIGKKFPSPPEVTREEVEGFYKMYKNRMEGKPLKEVAPAIEQYIREAKSREALGQFLEDIRKMPRSTSIRRSYKRLRSNLLR